MAASLYMIIREMRRAAGVYRRQLKILAFSMVLASIVDILYVLGISPIEDFNFTSITFTISGILLSLNILGNQFFDLIPLAYDAAVNVMHVGLIVLDVKDRLAYINPAAETIIGVAGEEAIGKAGDEILGEIGDLPSDPSTGSVEISIYREGCEAVYQRQVSGLFDRQEKQIGQVITLNDVTERVELHRKIEHLSATDPLTTAYNRRAFTTYSEQEIARAYRYQRNLSILLLDVDNFKEINDLFGHQRGDDILIEIVRTMSKTVRSTDMIFRFGGDEFVLLLVETDGAEAGKTAERIRAELEEIPVGIHEGVKINVSISVGVTSLEAEDSHSSMLQRVDRALYQAKDAGKNRVIRL